MSWEVLHEHIVSIGIELLNLAISRLEVILDSGSVQVPHFQALVHVETEKFEAAVVPRYRKNFGILCVDIEK